MPKYTFAGKPVVYREYGSGAEILTESGEVIADFKSHLDAEKFLDMAKAIELLKELSHRNSYEDYRNSVNELIAGI